MSATRIAASVLLGLGLCVGCSTEHATGDGSRGAARQAESTVPKARITKLRLEGDPFLHRTGHQVAAVRGDLYVERGVADDIATQTNTFRDDLFRMDPKTHDRIVATELRERGGADRPPPLAQPCMVADDARGGALLSFGGAHYVFEGDPAFFGSLEVYGTLWRYDVPEQRWRAIEPAGARPRPRAGCNAVLHDGAMYMFGGLSRFLALNDELWRFDLASETWTQLTPSGPVPEPRFIGATAIDHERGEMYLFSGHRLTATGFESIGDFWVYDIASNAFRALPPLPGPTRDEGTLSLLRAPGGKRYLVWADGHTEAPVLCTGFIEQNTALAEIWAFDPDTSSWQQLDVEGDAPRLEFVRSATVGNAAYLIGGWYDVPAPATICRQVWNEDVYELTLIEP